VREYRAGFFAGVIARLDRPPSIPDLSGKPAASGYLFPRYDDIACVRRRAPTDGAAYFFFVALAFGSGFRRLRIEADIEDVGIGGAPDGTDTQNPRPPG